MSDIEVKPLEWELCEDGATYHAQSILGRWAYWEDHYLTPDGHGGIKATNPSAAAQSDYEARIRSALAAPVPDFTPGIVENTEAGISELVIKDGPTVTGQEMTVRPLLDIETRQIVGFQWLSARLASTERTEGE